MNATHVHFEGTPFYNDQAMQYELSVINDDPHPDVDSYNWTTHFTVNINIPPVISSITDQLLKAPDQHSWVFGPAVASDEDTPNFSKSIQFDGSATIPSWLEYDLSDYSFNINNSSNSIYGVYTITLGVDDGYSDEVFFNFSLSILENLPPTRQRAINNLVIVNYNLLEYTFEDIYTLFNDPDDRTMRPVLRSPGGGSLPSFLRYNELNNTIYGTPHLTHVGTWDIEYAGVDDHDLEAFIPFKIYVKRKFIN